MISNERAKQVFAGDGTTTTFAVPFTFLKNTAETFDKNNQITVVLVDNTGTETMLVEDTQYQVNATSAQNGQYNGRVELFTAPASGEKLVIMRDVPLTQEVQPITHRTENALDKLTMALQEIKEEVDRAVKTGVSESAPATAEAYMDAITAAKETAESAATSAAGSASEAVIASATATAASTEATTQAQAAAQSADTATSAAVTAQSAEEGAQVAQAAAETAAASITTAIDEHNQSAAAHADLLATKQPKTLDTAITVAGESKTTVEAALSAINTLAAGKAAASHTHTKDDVTDLPAIPTKTSDLQNDSGFITDIPVASTSVPGKVKPDGTTVTADADGTLHAVGGGSSSSLTATYDSTNKVLTLR